MNWSPEQLLAINEEGQNIIVSAGAGSGKTAVLSERVLRKLKNGIHIDELLVLTFTKAAAAEMKERIRKKIKKTPGLEEEANLIDGAYITTFDSFSLSVVKKYHARLNVSNNIGITDEVVIELKKNTLLDEIMDEYYEKSDSKFLKLIEDFCLKNDNDLKKCIQKIYKKIELKYDKEKYLENFFQEELTSSKIDNFINEYLNIIYKDIKEIKNLIAELNEYFDGDFIAKIEDTLNNLLNAKNYEEILKALSFNRLPNSPKGSPEQGKQIKQNISDLIKEIREYSVYENTAIMKQEIVDTIEDAKVIISIVKELDQRLTKYKEENEIYNFTDISRMAIKVVNDNLDIRKELSESFNEILVDEYQDTSDTQETFINLIAHNNVYMVGDIKQSIYRFRNANPYIFKNKYDSYRDTDAGLKIDLVQNFRSREEVLKNINTLFDLFMDDEIGGADYKASHRMVFGNKTYNEEGHTEQNYNLKLLTYELDKSSPITKDEQEAFIIAYDIKDKINNHYQVFDKDEKILRDIKYSDFVVLLDKGKNFELYKKIFEYVGIPMSILKDESLRKDNDVLVLKNIIKLLICIKNKDYSDNFKYSFISVARSYLYRLSDEEIFDYFVNNNYFDSDIFKKFQELTKDIDIMPASSYLNYVLEELNYEEKILTIGSVQSYRIRTEYFYNLVKSFEDNGNTIYDFIDYLESIFDNESDLKFNVNTAGSDSCKIMTIHKSKGLEFPICYFAGFTSEFNLDELKEKIIYDNKYGLVLPRVTEYYKDTVLRKLLKYNTRKEEISERIRLLYVAVTRAKEQMIFVVPKIAEENSFVKDIVPSFQRSKYLSFYDIIKSIYPNIQNYEQEVLVQATKDYQASTKSNHELDTSAIEDNLIIESIDIPNEELEEKHFSKDTIHIVTKDEQETMDFGTNIHKLLEIIDFKNPNLELFDNNLIKNKIIAFINSELIQENINNNMYKEYEFIYEESIGIIDLLIERKDKMIIIDYKLKNIDDKNYENQLNGYRKVIEEKTKKETVCYLYSIMDEYFKKI